MGNLLGNAILRVEHHRTSLLKFYKNTTTKFPYVVKKKSIRSPLTVSSQKSILSRLLLRCSLPLIRLREGFPWLTPEVAPLGFSEDGVTLQERGMLKETGLQAGEHVSTRRLLWKRQTLSPQDAHSIQYYF